MFPQGAPGVALLLLRVAVALTLVATTVHHSGLYSLFFAGGLLVAVALIVGYLTPLMSGIAGAFTVANVLFGHQTDALIITLTILDAAALALLGPGAYSLDSRLYGRSVTVVPPRRDSGEL
jgi:uncharacterized membrane protein YphA (DoxX/SURF4 family)